MCAIFRDPARIILQGSNNYNSETGEGTFIKLYDSEATLTFSERSEENQFTFNNDEAYKHYAIVFEKNAGANKIHIGHYGLVQSYTNEVVAGFHKALTGTSVSSYVTSPPTETPTATPSNLPTGTPEGYQIYPGTMTVKHDQTLGTVPNPTSEWIITFTARFTLASDFYTHKGILRFTTTTGDCCRYGDRVPAFYTDNGTRRISFASGTTTNGNHYVKGGLGIIQLNKDHNFKAVAVGSYVKLYVDDTVIGQLSQDKGIRPVTGPLRVWAFSSHGTTAEGVTLSNVVYVPVI